VTSIRNRPSRRAAARSCLLALLLVADARALAAPGGSDEAPAPADSDRDRDRILRMQTALRDIVHASFGKLKVGLRVIEAHTGRVFFGRGATSLMDPASNQKVLATTTALVRLGNDFRFRTEVYGPLPDGSGVVHGDLYLRGSGDPTLAEPELQELASKIVARGITRVEGAVVADPRRFGDDGPMPGEDEPSQLTVNRGTVAIRVRPSAVIGGVPQVMLVPPPPPDPAGAVPDVVVVNQARTGEGRQRKLAVQVSTGRGSLQIEVAGKIGGASPGVVFRRRVPDRTLVAAILFRSALAGAGVAVRDRAAVGSLSPAATLLASHASAPLGVLLRKINKDSDNYEAERLLEAVGAEVQGGPATTEKGIAVLRDVIGEYGLDPRTYLPKNGSGLGHGNRVSAQAMTDLLRALYLDPRVGPELLQSLSIGGVDGTTRNRFRGTLVAGHVRAKTGTLNGKSCLSGLVGDGEDVMAFSIMVQGFRSRNALSAVRGAQVAAVNTMMRFVQERGGARADMPTGDAVPPGVDYETGGDTETEDDTTDVAPPAPTIERPPLALEESHTRLASLTRPAGRTTASVAPADTVEKPAPKEQPLPEEEPSPLGPMIGQVGVAGLGSLAGGDVAPGIGLFAAFGHADEGLGAELAFYGTVYRTIVGPGTGSTDWTRLALGIGPRYRLTNDYLSLDVRAQLGAGSFWVRGHEYVMNTNSKTLAVNAGAGARLAWRGPKVAPWVGLDAIAYPGRHTIAVTGVTDTRTIPGLDILLSIGASFLVW
jgi:D-alanyl-D-alanine carboxypeptidase/D-alanyl-D-alanine-endopeptidase (penicillin-binding protein 4)